MNLSYLFLVLQFYEFSEDRNINTDPTENLTDIYSYDYILPDSSFSNLEIEIQEEPIDLSFKLEGNNFSPKNVVFADANRFLAQKRFYQNTFELNKDLLHAHSKKSKPNNNLTISLPKNELNNTQLYKKHDTSNNKDCVLVNNQDPGIEKKGRYKSVKNVNNLNKILTQDNKEKRYENPNFISNTNLITNRNINKLNSSNLDKSMYEQNHNNETKFLQNISLSNSTINNKQLKLVSLDGLTTNHLSCIKLKDNRFQNMIKSENSFNNNIRLNDLNAYKVDNKNLDTGLHLIDQMFNDTNNIKNNIETFKDVNKIKNQYSIIKHAEKFANSFQNNYHGIKNGNLIKKNNMITKNDNKYYNIENWIELRTEILKNLCNLKEFLNKCTKIDTICLEIIIYEIKKIIKMLRIWESLINQIPLDSTILDESLYYELISLLSHIKNTTNGQILFPEIIFYDSNLSYFCTFKEKNLLKQNIIQKILFEIFKIFMTKIHNIDNISDIITRGQHFKLEIIRQILREFLYFTLESYFLENFKSLYKYLLHMILSNNEKKFLEILSDYKISDLKNTYCSRSFNSFSYHFRFIFIFTNPINYINYETDEQNMNTDKNIILIPNRKKLLTAYSKMVDFLSSLLNHKSLENFFYNLKQKNGILESYFLLCLVYLRKLNLIPYFSDKMKTMAEVTEINTRNYLNNIENLNTMRSSNNFEMNKIFNEKNNILADIFLEFRNLVEEIEVLELENFIK